MVRITDELLVSRAEHNDGHLPTLEEISLHQQKLEKIEYINRVCADLRILQFQDNCIEKIENLGRLKLLEYLNLAMNNIERVENTECLEKLEKLDLTLNFIGEITSIEVLTSNYYLRSLFLMGNPCAQYKFYREYVMATLPQLQFLDGTPIEKSERIKALQNLPSIRLEILNEQDRYMAKREREKVEIEEEIKEKAKSYNDPKMDLDTQRQNFYQSVAKHSPEYRKESARFREYLEEMDENAKNSNLYEEDLHLSGRKKKSRRLFDDHGKPLNINEANIDFFYDDSDDSVLRVELKIFKYLDTSLVDLDVQPTYLRATIKGKIFQLRFLEEVNPDSGKAERSQTTGHLVVTIPKARDVEFLRKKTKDKVDKLDKNDQSTAFLEVTEKTCMDFSKIVAHNQHQYDEMPPLEPVDD